MASERGNVEMCRLLLQFRANKESLDNKVLYFVQPNDSNHFCFVPYVQLKETPVYKAASGGHVPILQLLKERGCSFEVKNRVCVGTVTSTLIYSCFCVRVAMDLCIMPHC